MNIPARPWTQRQLPRRILAIRLQAMGDVVVTLPYLQGLRESLPPSVELDFLTREETEGVPRQIHLFNNVYALGGGRDKKKILLYTLLMLPRLLLRRYDVIIDMQHNIYSDIVRKTVRPKAWALFDRYSPISGAERYRQTVSAVGLGENEASYNLRLKDASKGLQLLRDKGWNGQDELVVLNPAGAFTTRNWAIDNYTAFARLWLEQRPRTKFLVLGVPFIAAKAAALQQQLGPHLLNLTGQTTTEEAFSILQHARLMLSEDSGLMHMAWISGIPTLAMFGSTRSDWSRPLGDHTFLLASSDLPCGDCMLASCPHGDVHCLTRHTPEKMLAHALSLIEKTTALS
ncbi:MAG: glycosyltransferase family 9 protein [Chitinophagaceae bacterium]|nr:glycosyltransferase family 9 protein [Chitinophagaceae bacterium]